MTKIGVSSILKTIKMNNFGSSGEYGRRSEACGTNESSRYGSGQRGGSRSYGGRYGPCGGGSYRYGGKNDGDRTRRGQFESDDRRQEVDRYGRSQSPENFYSGRRRSLSEGDQYGRDCFGRGNLDRNRQDRPRFHSGQSYGRDNRVGFEDERHGRESGAHAPCGSDRYGEGFGKQHTSRFQQYPVESRREDYRHSGRYREQYRDGRFPGRDAGFAARAGHVFDRHGHREVRHDSGERLGHRGGRHGSGERYGPEGARYGSPERFGSRGGYRRSVERFAPGGGRYGSGERYGPEGRRYGSPERFGPRVGHRGSAERFGPGGGRYSSPERFAPREGRHSSTERFGPREGRHGSTERFVQGGGRHGSGERFGREGGRYGSPERFGSRRGEGRFSVEPFGLEGGRYGNEELFRSRGGRHGSGDRFAFGEDHFAWDHQLGRGRFDGRRPDERRPGYQPRFDRFPREQFGPCRPEFRGESFSKIEVERARRYQLGGHRDVDNREDRYRTEGASNVNRRFQPFQIDGRPPRSAFRGHNTRDERGYEMQGGSKYQGGGQYGYQFSSDHMPPPIPPFSEPRTNYPTTLAVTDGTTDGVAQGSSGGNRCRELAVRAAYDLMRRRYYESAGDPSQNPTWLQRGAGASSHDPATVSPDALRVDNVNFRPLENAKESRTFEYELVRDREQPTPVFRRGETFLIVLRFVEREFDAERDNVYLNFYFGPNPSVPKRTRVVLPITPNTEFERVPHQWDVRVESRDTNSITVQVNIPASSPVGMWRCVVETSTRSESNNRLQYRCPEDIYVLFNPFCRDDSVYMESDSQRFEYVINETGKVYTGGYRNVRGRPWIYGQFDDCILPAACVLLEMSGLPHAERGNPVKVARALTSMVRASGQRDNSSNWGGSAAGSGLIEARFDDDCRGGNTPHLWTGSVQIIEEFLRGGAAPVKYAQCWVMAALMTTLCRTLGLPSRPVTAYLSALNTQDSLTVDRYVDKFGDVLEHGPGRDQPDAVWVFHVWCDVWMARPDQPQGYSGWQSTDPCRTYRDYRDLLSGACGPCPTEALRRGDVGQRDDVDAFYASLNSYVRYFHEDEQSGWGYSPFRQFRYPLCRHILTKAAGRFDDEGDTDCDDLTNVYRDNERSDDERFAVFNSCRGIRKDTPAFEYQAAAFNWGPFNPSNSDQSNFDVSFELDSPERSLIGDPLVILVVISNNSAEPRNVQTNICTRSSYYTGALGPYLKRSNTQFTLAPNQHETVTLTLDPWDYMDKLSDMSFIRITVSAFVQESGQSFIDEFDFRFNKPKLNIDVSEMAVGSESEATFSFSNPLDVPLTDCFLTMEVSGSARPRTVRIDREVRPHERFSYTQSFVPRFAGERRLVASFVSRQLQDIVGQRPVVVRE